MALMDIKLYGDEVLSTKARPISEFTPELRKLADDMAETMYEAHGIGIAANQVGVLQRIIIVDVEWPGDDEGERPPNPITMINPEVLEESIEDEPYDEGCLSIPGITGEVWRPERIKARYQTLDGETVEVECEGMMARCILHEIDHLDGVLFIDRMGKLKRRMIAGSLRKLLEQAGGASGVETEDGESVG